MAQTKIVATVGPGSDNAPILREMVKKGLSAVRINTAHVSEGYISKIKAIVDQINTALGSNVGVMVDLKGPELRTGVFRNGYLTIEKDREYSLASASAGGEDIEINFPSAFSNIEEGDSIIMSDGKVKFRTVSVSKTSANIIALTPGTLRDRSRVNVPGKYLDLGVLTERDISFLKEGINCGVEYYALSFVQKKENVMHLQKLIYEMGKTAAIVSKIETKSGFDNIASIADVSDYIMVARGDLGVEMPLEEVVLAQKVIIDEAHRHGVPTIVATQMLESMIDYPTPTRAEVSDVTNAILDNADAVMLSGETAIGKYPVDAVGYLTRIADYVENSRTDFPEPVEFYGNRVAYSIARASRVIAQEIRANAILAFTLTGNTVRMISAVRPEIPIYAAVTDGRVGRMLNLLRGVIPIPMPEKFRKTYELLDAVSYIESKGFFQKGERIVITSGAPYFLFGGTNDVRVMTIGSFRGRGYPIGPSIQGTVTMDPDGKGDIVLIRKKGWNRDKVASRFQGIIFTIDISDEDKEFLSAQNRTVLFNAKFTNEIEEGETVKIDSGTGTVNS